jgi:hypothetical protein
MDAPSIFIQTTHRLLCFVWNKMALTIHSVEKKWRDKSIKLYPFSNPAPELVRNEKA